MKRLAQILAVGLLLSGPSYCQETERVYLSGTDKDNTVPWRFLCTSGANSGTWTHLHVPSHWDIHGYGSLNYKKDVGSAVDEHGLYEHRFAVDSTWENKRIVLVFEGVMTDAKVKVNGSLAGPMHQGGFYRFKYEITSLLKFGTENVLEVDVAKHSANESVNKAERTADYWVFGGIYRPVYLEAFPQDYVERVAIDAKADGSLAVDAFVSSSRRDSSSNYEIVAQVYSLDDMKIGSPFRAVCEFDGETDESEKVRIPGKVDSPRLWTAETPNLYRLEVCLHKDGNIAHRRVERFGFRTIEVRPGEGIYLNGRRIILKGVNRHSTWPDSGRCLSDEIHRLDIEAMKSMNMNAVRMSHYPPDTAFLDLCDELGLYVLDELAGWHWSYDTHVGRRLVEEMVTRDVNHPSILFWNNGNEGGNNVALDEVFGWYDPQERTVLHPWEVFGYVNTAHYLTYDRAELACEGVPTRHGPGEEYQEWEDLNDPNKYIYMPTEMLHGLYDGGGGAGLEDYWRLMTDSRVLGGGFIWNLFDEGIRRPDGTLDLAGNQAPDGMLGPYREREASSYVIQHLWSPIQLKLTEENIVQIQNDYSFTNARDCSLDWSLCKFPSFYENDSTATVLAEKSCPLPDIPAGSSGEVRLDFPPEKLSTADALVAAVRDPHGRILWTWVWPLSELSLSTDVPAKDTGDLEITKNDGEWKIRGGNLVVRISSSDGLLKEVLQGSQQFSLRNGPVPTTGKFKLESIESQVSESQVRVDASYSGALRHVTWILHADGWMDCEYSYFAEGEHEFCGVTFDYPEELVKSKRWLGDGPFRVWKNRTKGVGLGVWQNDYNDTITGYSGWKYPEFKGCFSNVRWMQLYCTEGVLTFAPERRDIFVQVLTPSQPPAELTGMTKYNLPKCGIAFMDAIPPVGSKFKTAESTGPAGQFTYLEGVITGKVRFRFDPAKK